MAELKGCIPCLCVLLPGQSALSLYGWPTSRASEPRRPRTVTMLADGDLYLASKSTFSRMLCDEGQAARWGRAKRPRTVRPPTTQVATVPRLTQLSAEHGEPSLPC
jgi:putative transposase